MKHKPTQSVAGTTRQPWQSPTIERIGTFGAVMRGGSRPNPDPGSLMRKINNS